MCTSEVPARHIPKIAEIRSKHKTDITHITICEMLNNDDIKCLFLIPSQSSCFSYTILDRTVSGISRSESSPINTDNHRNKTLGKSPSDLFTFGTSNQTAGTRTNYSSLNNDSAFVRDAKSCPEGCIEKNCTTSSSTLFVTKRSHNFQVGLEMHEESVRSKRSFIVQGGHDSSSRMQTAFPRLPSAELWEALLQ